MDSYIVRYVALTSAEEELLQGILLQAKAVDCLTVKEYEALSSLREQLDLPPVVGL